MPSRKSSTSNPLSDSPEEPENSLPEILLDDLTPRMKTAAREAGWTKLMPVQARSIPYILSGRDLMVQSRTGSGKTGAFLLPSLDRIDFSQKTPQVLILVPTRELALQVARESETLAGDSELQQVTLYGGVGYDEQFRKLEAGAQLIIGTPGRVLDHLMRRSLILDEVKILVFDEADRLLSMGFYPDMKRLATYLPTRRDSFMFSATFPVSVQRLAAEFMDKPDFLSLSRDNVHVAEVAHVVYEIAAMDKDRALVRVLEMENPDSALIFCNTKMRVNYVAKVLQRFGYDADQLTSELSQSARERVIKRFYDGNLQFLVATDLAARGIDVENLSHVIQYEFPEDTEIYIHRAGRTGRAGAGGVAISFISVQERRDLSRTMSKYNIIVDKRTPPTEEDVQRVVADRAVALLEAKLRDRDKLQVERMQRMLPLVQNLCQSEDEQALLAMLVDDFYQHSTHALPGLPETRTPKKSEKPSGSGDKRRSSSDRGGRRGRSRRKS